MTDTVDRIIIQAEAQGVKLTTDQVDALRVAMDTTGKSGTTLENKFGALERQLGTTAGQAQKAAKDIDTINKAVAQGNISQERANDAISAVALRYGTATKAAKELSDAHAGLSGQAQALSHAFRSTVDSLASGAPVTQVLGQEFGRLSYVMSGQGGVAGAFKELAGTFGGILTPIRLVAGGIAGLAAGALYLANSWENAKDEVNLALIGISQRTGTTATDVANFTKANATATGLSVSEARNAALEFTKTGNVAIAGLKGVGDAIHGYALLTGKDATEATKDFVDAINNGLPGIEKLDGRYGSLNASTLEYIRTLVQSGDSTRALQVFIDATSSANEKAAESVGVLTKAWQGFKNVASNIASGPVPEPAKDTLAALQQQRDQLTTSGRNSRGEFLDTSQIAAALDALDAKIADAQKAANDFDTSHAVAQLDAMSKAAFNTVNAVLPQVDAIGKLDQAIENLRAAQTTPGAVAPGNNDAALAVLQHQRDLQQESLDTTVRQAQVANTLVAAYGGVTTQTALTLNNLQLQLNAAQALTGAAQMQAAAQATYTNLVTQGVAEEEAAAISAKQLEVSQAAATTQVLKQVEALKDQDAMIKAHQKGTEATTSAAIAYKNAINNGADATAAAALKAQILKNAMDQSANSAQAFLQAMYGAAQAVSAVQAGMSAVQNMGLGGLTPQQANGPVGGGSDTGSHPFGANDPYGFNTGSGGGQFTSTLGQEVLDTYNAIGTPNNKSVSQIANGAGSIDAAINAVQSLQAHGSSTPMFFLPGYGPIPFSQFGLDESKITNTALPESDIISQVQQLYNTKNIGASNSTQAANLQNELSWLQSRPQSLTRDTAIAQLKQSIDGLTKSTNTLNSTNQELLSPYYTQDPRTSHIGFRSQGMASGGYVDVPGAPSANDNMMAMIPVASGERIFVDPMSSKRGVGASTININVPITILGNANRDEVGRTVYQTMQLAGRQLAAAQR